MFISIKIFLTPSFKNAGKIYFTGTIEYAYTYSGDKLNIDSLSKTRPAIGIFRYDANNLWKDLQEKWIKETNIKFKN